MTDQDKFDRLKGRLTIDPMRLTEELIELPSLQQEASEMTAEWQKARDEAKDALELMKATVGYDIRSDTAYQRKPPEDQIKSEVLLSEDVQTANAALNDAEYNLSLWKSLADGMRAKSFAIGKIGDLISSGYTTPNSIYAERRTVINRERKRLLEGG